MFVKVPHYLMALGLPSNALKVYLYLLAAKGSKTSITVRYTTIARYCHIHKDTAVSVVKTLESCGLLQVEHRYCNGQYVSNRYTLAQIPGKWFKLDLSQKLFALPACAFGVYLCICRCANKKGRAFPSYSAISAMLGGRARATISSGIRLLEELGFVFRMEQWKGKHNLYVLGTKKERAQLLPCTRSVSKTFETPNSFCILTDFALFVNFSLSNTSSIFHQHGIDPPYSTIHKKKTSYFVRSIKRLTTIKDLWKTARPPPVESSWKINKGKEDSYGFGSYCNRLRETSHSRDEFPQR